MCGNCLLQETAFICPMECAKGLRNGPCGGSSADGCYVDPTRPCIWYKIYERAEKLNRMDKLMEVLPPLDWSKVGTDTWLDGYRHWKKTIGMRETLKALSLSKEEKTAMVDRFFTEIRQPVWWSGDDQPHPAPDHEPVSLLEKKLVSGEFAITVEVSPPLSNSSDEVIKKVDMLRPYVDAANFTDNPSATPRMSSLACSLICLQHGLEPVLQVAARDRTRMSVQAEVLGASALGIKNILCLTGDHSRMGPSPHGRMDIWDIDSIQMLWILRKMRDEGCFLDSRELKSSPEIFLGAAGSPFASEIRFQAIREEKKTNAGAQFFQTNLIYDVDHFRRYMEALQTHGIPDRAYILAGVAPIRSAKAACYMNQIPGIRIPQSIIDRLEKAADAKEEGVQIALEIIEGVRKIPGVSGIHFMSVTWESIVPRLIQESGLR
jgi:methylenetetrahydrofolate reductase (NADPH)